MKNLPTLRNDCLFAVQFSNSVLKTRAILLFTINIIEMFELHASMPPMQSAECQATIPQKFPISRLVDSDIAERRKRLEAIESKFRQPVDIFSGNQRVFKRWIHTLIYYTRCNHLKHTPLFPCVMFHIVYCRCQLFKRWITLYPSRQNIIQWIVQLVFLINTYPLNLVNSLEIHLLHNQELLCSTRVKMAVGKLACTC